MSNEYLKRSYPSRVYCSHEHPFVYATLIEFKDHEGKNAGLLQIHSDWGTYSNYWGALGDQTIEEFLIGCSPAYVENKLTAQMNFMGVKQIAYQRLTKFMAQCWPRVVEMMKESKP